MRGISVHMYRRQYTFLKKPRQKNQTEKPHTKKGGCFISPRPSEAYICVSILIHYMNQCWQIVNCTPGKILTYLSEVKIKIYNSSVAFSNQIKTRYRVNRTYTRLLILLHSLNHRIKATAQLEGSHMTYQSHCCYTVSLITCLRINRYVNRRYKDCVYGRC